MKIALVAINSRYTQSNLAILYLAAQLRALEPEVSFSMFEFNINETAEEIAIKLLKQHDFDAIAFSVYIWNIEAIIAVSGYIKKIKDSIKIIVGGPEVSFETPTFFKSHFEIDYLIRGEGEIAFVELIKALKSNNFTPKISGVCYRNKRDIIWSYPVIVKNLESIASPFLNGIYPENKNFIHFESTRGCPFNCAYCLSSRFELNVRCFPLERVKQELDVFFKSPFRMLRFIDRNFNLNKKHFLPIWKYILENSPENKKYQFEIDASLFDKETLDFLKTVPENLFQFEIGIQSINPQVLVLCNRKSNLENAFKSIKFLRENTKIHLHLDLISGLPGESFESYSEAINKLFSFLPHTIQIGRLKVLKGTEFHEKHEKLGLIYDENPPYCILKTRNMPWEKIIEIEHISRLNELYYNSEKFHTFFKVFGKKYGNNIMDFWIKLRKFWENNNLSYYAISLLKRFKILLKFLEQSDYDSNWLIEALLHDFLLAFDHKANHEEVFKDYFEFLSRNKEIMLFYNDNKYKVITGRRVKISKTNVSFKSFTTFKGIRLYLYDDKIKWIELKNNDIIQFDDEIKEFIFKTAKKIVISD